MQKNSHSLHIPELSLVVLIGASSSGKSTFARKHFKPTEIVSSDFCRGVVSDDENSVASSADAFDLARFITGKRLKNGLLTVIDATNVQAESRKGWVALAREHHVLPIAIIVNIPEKICTQRHEFRIDRTFGKHVIPQQISQLKRSIRNLKREGFRHIFEFTGPEEVESVLTIIRDPLYNNKKTEKGPFDIIGDVHGCYDELVALLNELGYQNDQEEGIFQHPEGRKLVFVGDLVDRGPKSTEVLKTVMGLVNRGLGWCVPGNHEIKLLKWLRGKNVQITHGLEVSIDQLQKEPPAFRQDVAAFIDGMISHYVFDEGKLVVAHAGLREEMHGRGSGAVRDFCLYGETTGESDEFGMPVRYNWASEYKGKAIIVYGHTPVRDAQWLNRTIDIDTGCVFGGKLTAFRYPEAEIISVPAYKVYCEPIRPLEDKPEQYVSLQKQHDDILNISDVTGKHIVETVYGNNITIREENSIAALEVMSRFAINPKWLIYLPPTMSPSETSKLDDYLEYPNEAFDYYRGVGVEKVVCQEKHMGSRAIVVIGKDEQTIQQTFGIENEGIGIIYTRTGRAYFNDKETEQAMLCRVNTALEKSGFYERFNTDWVCLDAELMPWSAKAQSLLEMQYGSVGASATHSLTAATAALQRGSTLNSEVTPLLEKYNIRLSQVDQFIKAYRKYCWPVNGIDDYKLAPFHILATEGNTWTHQNHEWHMESISQICKLDATIMMETPYRMVDLGDEGSLQDATEWWLALTRKGGEGMVVKPYQFIHTKNNRVVQPAIKIRGREYLRIIYGPEYTTPENIIKLRSRGLSSKRSLALREFALGIEALERFIKKEPLRRIHECVFGILALESEPVDPRL